MVSGWLYLDLEKKSGVSGHLNYPIFTPQP